MKALLAALLLAGCATVAERPAGWREVVTAQDRERLRGWRTAWTQALAEARAGGFGAQVAAEGALLHPDMGSGDPALPSGAYRCRTLKLGGDLLPFVAYPAFRCRVEGSRFVKLTGSQRPVGTLYPDGPRRAVFLGTLQLGDERAALPYGRDRSRDMAAWVERVGPDGWRMVFPRPAFESTLDVLELTPER